jgi:peptidoglycan L-alanyl-D-glutamate endopeptidase CwlK
MDFKRLYQYSTAFYKAALDSNTTTADTGMSDVEKQVSTLMKQFWQGAPPINDQSEVAPAQQQQPEVSSATKTPAATEEPQHQGIGSGTPVEVDSMSMSRLSELDSRFQPMVKKLLESAAQVGVRLRIVEGYRSNARQQELYDQGRTVKEDKNGKALTIVTNAKPGSSLHNFGLAVDVVPIEKEQMAWKKPESWWDSLGKFGQDLGLKWGGDGSFGFKDRDHFQYPITMADIVKGNFKPEKKG